MPMARRGRAAAGNRSSLSGPARSWRAPLDLRYCLAVIMRSRVGDRTVAPAEELGLAHPKLLPRDVVFVDVDAEAGSHRDRISRAVEPDLDREDRRVVETKVLG